MLLDPLTPETAKNVPGKCNLQCIHNYLILKLTVKIFFYVNGCRKVATFNQDLKICSIKFQGPTRGLLGKNTAISPSEKLQRLNEKAYIKQRTGHRILLKLGASRSDVCVVTSAGKRDHGDTHSSQTGAPLELKSPLL